uniref:RanBP2-type domain-containing protein n=1 Tax=viral metagenome TaxID=1070528 RepID=A0A6M3LHJ2_9ZZZZ
MTIRTKPTNTKYRTGWDVAFTVMQAWKCRRCKFNSTIYYDECPMCGSDMAAVKERRVKC